MLKHGSSNWMTSAPASTRSRASRFRISANRIASVLKSAFPASSATESATVIGPGRVTFSRPRRVRAGEPAAVHEDRRRPRHRSGEPGHLGQLRVAAAAGALLREALGVGVGEPVEETPDVVAAAQLAVADDGEAGLFLIEQRDPDGVVLRLAQFVARRAATGRAACSAAPARQVSAGCRRLRPRASEATERRYGTSALLSITRRGARRNVPAPAPSSACRTRAADRRA